ERERGGDPTFHVPRLVDSPIVCEYPSRLFWTGVRVAEGAGLENRCTGNGTVGSNPTLSVSQRAGAPSRRVARLKREGPRVARRARRESTCGSRPVPRHRRVRTGGRVV